MEHATVWIGFLCFVCAMLALDLGVFHRKAHAIGFREALGWSAVWLAMGLSFAVLVFHAYEHKWWGLGLGLDPVDGVINSGYSAAQKYLTGYVVEKSLSVDNIFVIAMIFGSLAVPAMHQHRVLFWGILGAIAMRGVMMRSMVGSLAARCSSTGSLIGFFSSMASRTLRLKPAMLRTPSAAISW